MRRREFLSLVSGAIALPAAARAQQSAIAAKLNEVSLWLVAAVGGYGDALGLFRGSGGQ